MVERKILSTVHSFLLFILPFFRLIAAIEKCSAGVGSNNAPADNKESEEKCIIFNKTRTKQSVSNAIKWSVSDKLNENN